MDNDKILSAFGDGWYDGFLAAMEIAKTGGLNELTADDIRRMSEEAELESQIFKNRPQQLKRSVEAPLINKRNRPCLSN